MILTIEKWNNTPPAPSQEDNTPPAPSQEGNTPPTPSQEGNRREREIDRKRCGVKISIFEQIGSNAAVSSEDGEVLYERIVKGLAEKDVIIILDFTNIEIITPTFLNAAIGQLYNKYDSPFLRERLKVNNLAKEDLELLKKVVERAKEYFKENSTDFNCK
ncbi:MAG: STAS-like domain-containing protein [Candidatus Desantisbacteria bacterium]